MKPDATFLANIYENSYFCISIMLRQNLVKMSDNFPCIGDRATVCCSDNVMGTCRTCLNSSALQARLENMLHYGQEILESFSNKLQGILDCICRQVTLWRNEEKIR